ncbi:MAG: DciA family protein [Deltaproteobacteria bacterium]|nr:DciA family protein [Deltaproteobacteria bacterium]
MSSRRKKSFPTELSSILETFLGKKKYKKRIEDCKVFEYWHSCVGDKIAAHAEPEAFTRGVLKVTVSDHGWLQQLQFLKEEIKNRLNERLGKNSVENIYFKIGALKAQKAEAPHIEAELKKISLSEKERKRIEEATSNIGNGEIKKSIKRAMAKEAKRKKLVQMLQNEGKK